MAALVAGYFAMLFLEAKWMVNEVHPNDFNRIMGLWAGVNLILSGILLGATFFTRDEHDTARDFLYLLPVSRREILRVKIRAFLSQLFLFFVLALIPMLCLVGIQTVLAIGMLSLAAAALAGFVTAILLLHCRTVILTLVGAVVCATALLVIFVPDLVVSGQGKLSQTEAWAFWTVFFKLLAGAGLLAGWLFFVFCRKKLQELGATARILLAFLFAVTAFELFFTLFLCNPRDLIFILLGV
jgi:hypothetical protein